LEPILLRNPYRLGEYLLSGILILLISACGKSYCQPLVIQKSTSLSALTLTITSSNPSCGYDNGSIFVTASGGTPPYKYSLNGSLQNNGYFPSLNSFNNYPNTVLVTDATGQTASGQIILMNTLLPPLLSIVATTLPSTCTSADGVITLTGGNGVPPYQYSIDGINYSPNNVFSGLTIGTYFFFAKDANGCVVEAGFGFLPGQFDPAKSCGLQCNGEGTDVSCMNNGQFNITASGGTQPYQYSIDGVNYVSNPLNPASSQDYNNMPPGLYHVYVKDANGTIAVSAYQLIKFCGVSINYVIVGAACHQNNGSITITATQGTPPYTFTMDGTNFQASNVFNDLSAGVYSFSVKDAMGALYSIQASVYDSCPSVRLMGEPDTCAQGKGSIEAFGSSGTQPYLFSIDGIIFQTDSLFEGLLQGKYTITIKDLNGFTAKDSILIGNDCIQLTLASVNASCGQNNGSLIANASQGTPPYLFSLDGVNFQASNIFDNLSSGNYMVTTKDAQGLTAVSSAAIISIQPPSISISTTPVSCAGTAGAIAVTVTGGTLPFLYSINNGATLQPSNIFSDLDSGTYLALIEDSNKCMASESVHLAGLPIPIFTLGPDTTLCSGQSLLLKAPDSVGYSFLWQDNSHAYEFAVTNQGSYYVQITNQSGCSFSDTIAVNFVQAPLFTLGNDTSLCVGQSLLVQPHPAIQGSYQWNTGSTASTLTVQSQGTYLLKISQGGCASQESINVTYKPIPVINLGDDTTLCVGQNLTLDASVSGASYLWQDGSNEPEFIVSQAGTYSVKVDQNGCDTTGSVKVAYLSKPIISLGNDTTLCNTEILLLNVSYPASTYLWQNGSASPEFSVSAAGIYTALVSNICGQSSDSINVTYENCACKFYVPNAFTPNNDGKNDIFQPKYECVFDNYDLRIFNRWGQLVFDSRQATTGWDGTKNGQPQPTGTYVWELSYRDSLTGKTEIKKGSLVLIR
jgi:gliding motility-associated-like protein